MADSKISEFATVTTPGGGDLIPLVQSVSGTLTNFKMTLTQLLAFVQSGLTWTTARLVAVRTYTGTSDTFVLADAGGAVHGNNTSDIVQTIPANASVAFPVGTTLLVRQYGVGVITIAPDSGVTLRNGGATAKTAGRYAGSISLHKVGTDEWYLDGTVAAS